MDTAEQLLTRATAAIEGGEQRPQQIEMAQAVERAFTRKRHLAVQGPTGVGKSLAYLVPAIAAASTGEDDDRTVVVTSSRALQDQLARQDLPFLAASLGVPVRWAVLKGRSNYVCVAAAQDVAVQLRRGEHQERLDVGSPEDAPPTLDLDDDELREEAEALLEWAEATGTGDSAELEHTPSWPAWSAVSVGPGECVGAANCAHAEDCFSEAARRDADDADVLVVNAHLYAAHLRTGGTLLPPHRRLVIDEAHEFEDAIVGALGVELTEGRLANLARVHASCVADDERVGTSLRSAGRMLDAMLEGRMSSATKGAGSNGAPVRIRDGLGPELSGVVATVVSAADRALNSLRRAARLAPQGAVRHRMDRAVRVTEGVLGDAQALLGEQGPGTVCWIEKGRSGRHVLRLTRIDVAATLRAAAWDEHEITVVCCSATLDRGTAQRLGLDAEYLAVDSPFDFREQALLYVPKLSRPNQPAWPEQVADVVVQVMTSLHGRTLALFTSNRMLHATVERCREALPDVTILCQGDAPNPVLQRRFLEEEHTCLFATASFWTGISSPGTTCSAVVLDKIPFPVPTDPIVEARSELVGDTRAFAEVSVPAAAMQLAQGVGRLIRTSTDRGLVVVCDPRLAEAGYRQRMLDLLPPMRRERNPRAVERFIESLGLVEAPG